MADSGSSFESTHPSEIAAARAEPKDGPRENLNGLLRRYRPALVRHVRIRFRKPDDEAEDLVQGYVTKRILEKDLLGRLDGRPGRFRNFLRTTLDNFVISQFRHDNGAAQKPAGARILSIDREDQLPAVPDDAGDAFDVEYARITLAETVKRMRTTYLAAGWEKGWRVFEHRVLRPLLRRAEPLPHEQIVRRVRLRSASQSSRLQKRATEDYARVLHDVVGEYMGGDEDVEEEIALLREILLHAAWRSPELRRREGTQEGQ